MAQVHIVLVRPRRPENIGAVARVVANTGLAGLRLVQPGDWRTVEAFRMAWQAEEVLEDAAVFPTLAEAVGGCRLVAGTQRPRPGRDSASDPAGNSRAKSAGSRPPVR